jgi:hypothetical protein
MSLELALIGAAAGAVLGLRYKVMVLVPAVMFSMLFAVIVGVARGDGFGTVVLMTVALPAAVQVGYLAGVAMRAVAESVRAFLIRERTIPSSVLWGK